MSEHSQNDAQIIKETTQEHVIGVAANFSHHSGPLPAPEQLQKYEEVKAGLAESESTHRHECEKVALMCQVDTAKQESEIVKRGQNCAIASIGLMVAGAVICAYYNQVAIGMTLGGISAVSIIAAFLKTNTPVSQPQSNELNDKQELSSNKKS